jgi:hypothetical protein
MAEAIGTAEDDEYSVRAEARRNFFPDRALAAAGGAVNESRVREGWRCLKARAMAHSNQAEPVGSRQFSPPDRWEFLARTGRRIGGARNRFLS